MGVVVASRVLWAGGRFCAFVMVGRALGPNGTGRVAGVLAVGAVIALVVGLGLKSSAIYFLPRYAANGTPQLRVGFLRSSSERIALLGSVAIALAWVAEWLDVFAAAPPGFLVLSAVLGAALAFLGLYSEVLRADDLAHWSWGISQGLHAVLSVGLVGLAAIVGLSWNGFTGAFALAAALTAAVMAPYSLASSGHGSDRSEAREWWRYSLPLAFSGGSLLLLAQVPVVVVSAVASGAEAGGYAVVYRVGALPVLLTGAASGTLAPRCVQLLRSGDVAAARSRYWLCVGVGIALALPGLVAVIVLRTQILGLYGDSFAPFAQAIPIIAVGLASAGAVGPVAYLLAALGRNWDVLWSYLGIGTLGVAACAVAASQSGAVGAAWAISIAMAAQGFTQALLLRRAFRAFALEQAASSTVTVGGSGLNPGTSRSPGDSHQ